MKNRKKETQGNEELDSKAKRGNGTDYNEYDMGITEKLIYCFVGMAVLFLVGYVFYRNLIFSAFLALFGLKYPKMRREQIIRSRKSGGHQFQFLYNKRIRVIILLLHIPKCYKKRPLHGISCTHRRGQAVEHILRAGIFYDEICGGLYGTDFYDAYRARGCKHITGCYLNRDNLVKENCRY